MDICKSCSATEIANDAYTCCLLPKRQIFVLKERTANTWIQDTIAVIHCQKTYHCQPSTHKRLKQEHQVIAQVPEQILFFFFRIPEQHLKWRQTSMFAFPRFSISVVRLFEAPCFITRLRDAGRSAEVLKYYFEANTFSLWPCVTALVWI